MTTNLSWHSVIGDHSRWLEVCTNSSDKCEKYLLGAQVITNICSLTVQNLPTVLKTLISLFQRSSRKRQISNKCKK